MPRKRCSLDSARVEDSSLSYQCLDMSTTWLTITITTERATTHGDALLIVINVGPARSNGAIKSALERDREHYVVVEVILDRDRLRGYRAEEKRERKLLLR